MLIAPPWWLLFVQDSMYRLGIITGFITFFLALVFSISGALPFECLVATAGYFFFFFFLFQASLAKDLL